MVSDRFLSAKSFRVVLFFPFGVLSTSPKVVLKAIVLVIKNGVQKEKMLGIRFQKAKLLIEATGRLV